MGGAENDAPLLAVRDLCYAYGATQVLTDVTFRVRAGEVAALAGRNGAGKSTLLRCIGGWTRARSGEIRVLGASVAEAERRIRRDAVLVPDTPAFWDDRALGPLRHPDGGR